MTNQECIPLLGISLYALPHSHFHGNHLRKLFVWMMYDFISIFPFWRYCFLPPTLILIFTCVSFLSLSQLSFSLSLSLFSLFLSLALSVSVSLPLSLTSRLVLCYLFLSWFLTLSIFTFLKLKFEIPLKINFDSSSAVYFFSRFPFIPLFKIVNYSLFSISAFSILFFQL